MTSKNFFITNSKQLRGDAVLHYASNQLVTPDHTSTTYVAAPKKGSLVYNNTDNYVYYYNGSSWVQLQTTSSSGATDEISVTHTLTSNNTWETAATYSVTSDDAYHGKAILTYSYSGYSGSKQVNTTFVFSGLVAASTSDVDSLESGLTGNGDIRFTDDGASIKLQVKGEIGGIWSGEYEIIS